MKGIILFSYNILEKRDSLSTFYEHLFHGYIPEGYMGRKENEYVAFGFTDPLTHYIKSIARSLELATGARVYHGCKHSSPFVEDAMEQIIQDGITELYMLSLSPLISKTGTISYEQKVKKIVAEKAPNIRVKSLNGYSTNEQFIKLLADRIDEAATYINYHQPKIIFTSHSLPGTQNSNRDFITQYQKLADDIMAVLPNRYDYRLAYRSVGPQDQKWLRPDILDVLKEEKEAGTKAVIVCELLSIVENMEVIEEIGQQAKAFALQNDIEFIQSRYLNDSFEFVTFLKNLL